jgi:hypothetical protein
MPDGNFDESNGQIAPKQAPKTGNPLVHWLSAFASLGVLAGMVFWGLQLVQRNPNEVPVIKAMEGPARALPEDPGGAQLDHAGLAVNSVQSDGSAQAPAERVVLAPAAPELHADDVAVAKQVVAVKPVAAAEAEPEVDDVETVPQVAKAMSELVDEPIKLTELEDRTAEDTPVTLKIMPVPEGAMIDTSDGVAKLVTDEDLAAAEAERKAAEEAALKAAKERAAILLEEEERQRGTKYAPLVASAPPARPTQSKAAKAFRIKKEMKAAAAAKKTAVNPSAQEVAEVPAGTWLVQIGAFESREVALSEWSRISRRNSDLFSSKKYTIQLAESGGRKFYRLRTVGFADAKSSKSFCSALKQRKLDCIAVAVR